MLFFGPVPVPANMAQLLFLLMFTIVVAGNALITPTPAVVPRELSLGLQTCGYYSDGAKYGGCE